MLRKAGARLRTTKGSATRAWAMGMISGEVRKFKGGWFRATMKPNPRVTAEVPSGSISIASNPRLNQDSLSLASAHEAGNPSARAMITVAPA